MFQLQHNKYPLSVGETFDLMKHCQGIVAVAINAEIHCSRPISTYFNQVVYSTAYLRVPLPVVR